MLITRAEIQQIYRLILGRDADDAALAYWLPKVREYAISRRKFASILISVEEDRATDEAGVLETIHNAEVEGLVAHAEKLVTALGSPAEALKELGTEAWHHSFVLSDGTRVSGGKTLETLQREFDAIFAPLDLHGRTVLDIGAWNGAFAFEAVRRGAARVLAVDLYTWVDPRFRGLERFLYVRKDSGCYNVDYRILDVRDINRAAVGSFDVVLFLDVLYHLREPLSIFDRLAEIAEECLVLQTYLDQVDDVSYPAMRYFPGDELAGDPSNWWGPNQACVEALLGTSGFSDIGSRRHPVGMDRGIFHARK